MWLPFWSKYERIRFTKFSNPCAPLSADGWNFWLNSVPLEAIPWSNFATEFAAAVGPLVSFPADGETPSAIGLPANLFFGTGIPVCVLVLKRERNGNSDNILFIDASNDYEAGKNQNILRECDIDRIVEAYERREDVDKYAHVATMAEIEENGFNLNIPRYVDTFESEEEIDLNEIVTPEN